MDDLPSRLILYDGVCAMCNAIVRWLLRIDRDAVFSFAPLQGETADRVRQAHPEVPDELDTMVLVRDGEVFLRSRGALEAIRELNYPWRSLSWLRFFPVSWTDFGYRLLATNRYRVFGQYAECPLPPERHRGRFLP